MELDEPISLINVHDDGTLEANSLALDLLRKLNGNISVVCVCGLYRSGKSSLLNWLLNRNTGFTVGSTVNRCTRFVIYNL